MRLDILDNEIVKLLNIDLSTDEGKYLLIQHLKKMPLTPHERTLYYIFFNFVYKVNFDPEYDAQDGNIVTWMDGKLTDSGTSIDDIIQQVSSLDNFATKEDLNNINYKDILNIPSINNKELKGNLSLSDLNIQGVISDLSTIRSGASKGKTAVQTVNNIHPDTSGNVNIEIPTLDSELRDIVDEHVNNEDIHVTSEDKEFWNNKIDSVTVTSTESTPSFPTDTIEQLVKRDKNIYPITIPQAIIDENGKDLNTILSELVIGETDIHELTSEEIDAIWNSVF